VEVDIDGNGNWTEITVKQTYALVNGQAKVAASQSLMHTVNADGSEAEACGNGYRCIGLYAHKILGFKDTMRVETLSGEVTISVKPGVIKVKMIDPNDYRDHVTLSDLGTDSKALSCAFINTGVPHAVVFTEGLESVEVQHLGASIRHHATFQPKGTNVDFVEMNGENQLSVRTYERGVEAETLACGTGVTAVAAVACLTKRVSSPISVKTKSGEVSKLVRCRRGTVLAY